MKKTFLTLQILTCALSANLQASDDFLWEGGIDNGDGWKISPWFGAIETTSYPWIYNESESCWLWINDLGEANDPESIWIWDDQLQKWRFNSDSSYPWLYVWEESEGESFWAYVNEAYNSRAFYIDEEQEWLTPAATKLYREAETSIAQVTYTRGNQVDETWVDLDDSDEIEYDDDNLIIEYYSVTVDAFTMGKTEVTNDDVARVFNWGINNGHISVVDDKIKNVYGNSYQLIDLSISTSALSIDEGQLVIDEGMGDYPCVAINWFGAVLYCNLLSSYEGLTPCFELSTWTCDFSADGYRLPTEAEWEYAARGGLETERYSWGNQITHDNANYYSYDSSDLSYDVSTTDAYHPNFNEGSAPVASFPANAYGLYDMSGNVWEWCYDRYDDYEDEDEINPIGTDARNSSKRSIRGGSYMESAYSCRVTNRAWQQPLNSTKNTGFRICRNSDS